VFFDKAEENKTEQSQILILATFTSFYCWFLKEVMYVIVPD